MTKALNLSPNELNKVYLVGELNNLISDKFKSLGIEVQEITKIVGFNIDIGQKNFPKDAFEFYEKIRREAELELKSKYMTDPDLLPSLKKLLDKIE